MQQKKSNVRGISTATTISKRELFVTKINDLQPLILSLS